MSDRPCNYCEYQRLLKKYGSRLIVEPANGSLGGTNVYLDNKESLIVWYMELPSSCRC